MPMCDILLRHFSKVMLYTESIRVAYSYLLYILDIIRIHHIVFELCLLEKEERKKMNKVEIFTFGFLNFDIG